MEVCISEEIKKSILVFIKSDTKKRTPSDIDIFLNKNYSLKRNEVKKYIQSLILSGDLEYINQFGRTYIDLSFHKPLRVSDNIVLKPYNKKYESKSSDIVVNLQKGFSFGIGSHPTTRLSLNGMDYILNSEKKNTLSKQSALDIGTGSGVLAITAALFGVGYVYASDIDAIAIDETKKNALLNNINYNLSVNKNFDSSRSYDYIFANLRFPTLMDLFPLFLIMTHIHSYLVLSGIKKDEKKIIENKYSHQIKFDKKWEETDTGWVGLVFQRIKL